MKKIPTMFERDWDGDRSRVIDKPHKNCGWVFDGEGIATRKLDGTCCMIRDSKLYKRREVKEGQDMPPDFEVIGTDEETGKTVGWVPVSETDPTDAWHREAFELLKHGGDIVDGTYELLGPKVQKNPEAYQSHVLIRHDLTLALPFEGPRTFEGIRDFLAGQDIEGLVFHHPDGRMAKIKLRDFGLKRSKP